MICCHIRVGKWEKGFGVLWFGAAKIQDKPISFLGKLVKRDRRYLVGFAQRFSDHKVDSGTVDYTNRITHCEQSILSCGGQMQFDMIYLCCAREICGKRQQNVWICTDILVPAEFCRRKELPRL